jgi:hypothetical protein
MRPFLTTATLIWLALSSAGAAEKTKPVFQIQVWAGPDAKADPRVVRIYNHQACAARVAIVRVDRMPAPAKQESALGPELVVELDKSGTTIRRWGMPVDTMVAGVVGDRIIVPLSDAHAGAKALSISSSGALASATIPASAPFGQVRRCPSIKAFEGSSYLRCFEFRDLKSGEVRNIAYQAPCT